MIKNCLQCNKEFHTFPSRIRVGKGIFCSKICTDISPEFSRRIATGRPPYKPTQETRRRMSEATRLRFLKGEQFGFVKVWKQDPRAFAGTKSPVWISDRGLIKLDKERGGPLHKQWSKNVKNRDGWKCKISNSDCSGRLESHHILGWAEHPELRYEINNGIALCHYHHPRKRADERELSPYFQRLVLKVN